MVTCNFCALVSDVSGGYSLSILNTIRNTLDVSIHVSFGKGEDYAPLTYHEAFYLATLGGARGTVICCCLHILPESNHGLSKPVAVTSYEGSVVLSSQFSKVFKI